ncbi:MAG TPA: hypothetical protein VK254_04780, partial [Candidatus Bathyarchaeia archaeon]|nr:hypothetical protein [Candidatus Bathyarchaeia archaeon]
MEYFAVKGFAHFENQRGMGVSAQLHHKGCPSLFLRSVAGEMDSQKYLLREVPYGGKGFVEFCIVRLQKNAQNGRAACAGRIALGDPPLLRSEVGEMSQFLANLGVQ